MGDEQAGQIPAGSFPFQCATAREAPAFPPAPLGNVQRALRPATLSLAAQPGMPQAKNSRKLNAYYRCR
jgi:hypothetical protein